MISTCLNENEVSAVKPFGFSFDVIIHFSMYKIDDFIEVVKVLFVVFGRFFSFIEFMGKIDMIEDKMEHTRLI